MKDVISKAGVPGQMALAYLSALYGYAMTLTHDVGKAEDLVQETYQRAMRALDRLTPTSNLKGWLFTLMRSLWFDEPHNGASDQGSNTDSAEGGVVESWDADGSPHVIFLRKITRPEVRSAIESLPVHYREVVVLRDIEDFTYQEIAAVLDCPVGTVMSRLGRAREKLRLLLDQWQGYARTKVNV